MPRTRTNDSGGVEWFECTRFDATLDETVVGYITESEDAVAAFEWAQRQPGYNSNVVVLFEIEGGGVFVEFDYWTVLDVAPWPDLHVLDTDCAPFPEPNPAVCA